ncbi:MAG TPA: biotin-dependent carboxyltransferase family protein [Phycisphaerales bacterium]|nr:biotin-dependent carboxyltransferase family protein [Phycisphaerales bacterium]
MTRMCTILHPGMFTTIQDLGRFGHASRGVTTSGAMDVHAAILANRLVGNPDNAPLLEMTLIGGVFHFTAPATIALTGAIAQFTFQTPSAAPITLSLNRAHALAADTTLSISRTTLSARLYLAIAGGLDIPCILGSRSTNLFARFGGLHGRPLKSGDSIPLGTPAAPPPRLTTPDALDAFLTARLKTRILRCIPGPQHDNFHVPDHFWSAGFKVSSRSDRMGLRLEGPSIPAPFEGRLPSQCTPHGAVQIPPDGSPIILGADHPTTGGYPVIANVAAVDLPLLGQLAPGDEITFAKIDHERALSLLRQSTAALNALIPPNPSPKAPPHP